MNELIIIGKTISTFGIKGELKVLSDFERYEDAFQVGRKILINNINHEITSVRYHKNLILMGVDNLDNINLVLDYVGFNIYMKKSDLNLDSNEYLYSDLVNATVIDDNGDILGKVIEIENNINNVLLKVSGKKTFLIPHVDAYIKSFDKNKNILYTVNARDLIL